MQDINRGPKSHHKTLTMKTMLMLALIALLLNSCQSDKAGEEAIRICRIDQNTPVKDLGVFAEQVSFIQIQQCQESALRNIRKLSINQEEIFILDTDRKGIFVFDPDGKFLRRIARPGRGPGELLAPKDFAFDKQKNTLEILDWALQEILVFSVHGDYLGSIPLSESYDGFHRYADQEYVFERSLSSFVFYGSDGPALREQAETYFMAYGAPARKKLFFPAPEQRIRDGTIRYNRHCFSTFSEGVLYWQMFDNNIYYLTGDQHEKTFVIDFGRRNIPEDILRMPMIQRLAELNKPYAMERYYGMINDVVGLDQAILFSCLRAGEKQVFFWDLEADEVWQVKHPAFASAELTLFKLNEKQFASLGYTSTEAGEAPVLGLWLFTFPG